MKRGLVMWQNNRLDRRQVLKVVGAGAVVAGMPTVAVSGSGKTQLMITGQALVGHDLRSPEYKGYAAIRQYLATADIAFTNLEVAIGDPAKHEPMRDDIFFHAAEPDVLDCLSDMGFDILALANNHVWDLGPDGFLATMDAVTAAGMQTTGGGLTLDQSSAPAFVPAGSHNIAFINMATGKLFPDSVATAARAGVNPLGVDARGILDHGDAHRNLRSVQQAAASGATPVVCHHNHTWGPDLWQTPAWQRRWARECIDAGAAIYVSHGATMLHGVEVYKGRPIFYNLGNFIFQTRTDPGYYQPESWESVILDCHFESNRLHEVRMRPVVLNEYGQEGEYFMQTRGCPVFAESRDASRIIGRLAHLANQYSTTIAIDGDQGVLSLT